MFPESPSLREQTYQEANILWNKLVDQVSPTFDLRLRELDLDLSSPQEKVFTIHQVFK